MTEPTDHASDTLNGLDCSFIVGIGCLVFLDWQLQIDDTHNLKEIAHEMSTII